MVDSDFQRAAPFRLQARKKERKKKPQDENIIDCPIPKGGHKNIIAKLRERSAPYHHSLEGVSASVAVWHTTAYHYLGLVTFCVSRRRRKMYCGHARLCVCLSVRGRMPTLLHVPGCNLGSGRGCPLVVHYGADL